jgi:uncharacterized damage-inducible protein DinB
MTDLRYPIGEFQFDGRTLTAGEREELIDRIAAQPDRLREAVTGLDDEQLDTPYRPGGWTVRQVAHHVPDSHMNALTRLKLALTEEVPTIRPYDEDAWAKLEDVRLTPISVSLDLLDALHRRWVMLLRSLTPEQFGRSFRHPEIGDVSLDKMLALYAWHGDHHVGHVTSLRERMGW